MNLSRRGLFGAFGALTVLSKGHTATPTTTAPAAPAVGLKNRIPSYGPMHYSVADALLSGHKLKSMGALLIELQYCKGLAERIGKPGIRNRFQIWEVPGVHNIWDITSGYGGHHTKVSHPVVAYTETSALTFDNGQVRVHEDSVFKLMDKYADGVAGCTPCGMVVWCEMENGAQPVLTHELDDVSRIAGLPITPNGSDIVYKWHPADSYLFSL